MKINTLMYQLYHFVCDIANHSSSSKNAIASRKVFELACGSLTTNELLYRPRWSSKGFKKAVVESYAKEYQTLLKTFEGQLLGIMSGLRKGRLDYADKGTTIVRGLCDDLDIILSRWSRIDLTWVGTRLAIAHALIESAVCGPDFYDNVYALCFAVLVQFDTLGGILSPIALASGNRELLKSVEEVKEGYQSLLLVMESDVYVESY